MDKSSLLIDELRGVVKLTMIFLPAINTVYPPTRASISHLVLRCTSSRQFGFSKPDWSIHEFYKDWHESLSRQGPEVLKTYMRADDRW
jgi:hypothetical protein